jgi:surface-anchored protein
VQIFQFQPLSDHYHQGNPINLVLAADPPPAQGDQIVWEWKWPGTDWTNYPGGSGFSRTVTAEQALDGLQVRATLAFASTNTTVTAGPVTIFVDDHGAAARQQPIIVGATFHTAGNLVTLTRHLPANGPTILTTHRWERKAAGATEFSPVAGASGATLSFTATTADGGAEYRVAILKPDGTVAYGPSPAVTLDVDEPAPIPLRQVVLDVGHIDLFELTWDTNAGHLDLKVKDDTTLYSPKVEFRSPEDVTVLVDTALSELTFGDDDLPPGFEFIPRNQPVYFLEQVQQDGLPWPGWSTERFLGSLPEGISVPHELGAVEFAVEVSGPGDVVTFLTGDFGEPVNRFIDTTDEMPDLIKTWSGTHTHTVWMFTAPGDYVLRVTPRAYPSFPSKANPLTGPARSYHFRVGPRPEFEALPEGFEASIAGVPESVTTGTPVNLELVLDGPQPAIGGYQWYRFTDGVGIETIPGATNLTVSLTANPWEGAQVAIFDPSGRKLVHTVVQFLPPPSPPFATHNVNAFSDAPATAGVSWATVYDGRSPLTRQVVTLIPQFDDPIVQEVAGHVTEAAFSDVPAGTYTATVQAFNALGAGAVSAPSASFAVEVEPPGLSISLGGTPVSTANLTIATENGKTYQLEFCPTLADPWTDIGGPIPGTGQFLRESVPISGPSGFFRWRITHAP